MSTDPSDVRKAQQLVAVTQEVRDEGRAGAAERHPVFWPGLSPDEAEHAWVDLLRWVENLRVRYPNMTRLPDCWWRHNDLVEVLSALRDHERGCFTPGAPATAAVEWQRALRDMEIRMEIWIRRFSCSVSGRGHETPVNQEGVLPDGWSEFIRRDADRRTAAQVRAGEEGTESPTRGPSH